MSTKQSRFNDQIEDLIGKKIKNYLPVNLNFFNIPSKIERWISICLNFWLINHWLKEKQKSDPSLLLPVWRVDVIDKWGGGERGGWGQHYSVSAVLSSTPEGENENIWFHCFLVASDQHVFIIITSLPLSFSLSHSSFLPLFVLLINFITLIAPLLPLAKTITSLPPSTSLSLSLFPLFCFFLRAVISHELLRREHLSFVSLKICQFNKHIIVKFVCHCFVVPFKTLYYNGIMKTWDVTKRCWELERIQCKHCKKLH